MVRKVPTDPKLYREALARVRAGLRHRIIRSSIDPVKLTGTCEVCGPDQKVYRNNEWFTCANYYVDKQLRDQLKQAGERIPPAKKGRMKVAEIQRPINVEHDPSEQYVPWDDRDLEAKPLPGFDPTQYPRPDQLPAKIADYLDAQAQAQDHACFACGIPIRMVFTGGNTQRRTFGVTVIRQPRGGHTQVRLSDEVFCHDCIDWLQRANPNPVFHLRMAEVLAHFGGIAKTRGARLPLQDPSEQTRILTNHRVIAAPIPE